MRPVSSQEQTVAFDDANRPIRFPSCNKRIPDLTELESLEVFHIGGCQMRHPMVQQGERQSRINDLAESGFGLGCPLPKAR